MVQHVAVQDGGPTEVDEAQPDEAGHIVRVRDGVVELPLAVDDSTAPGLHDLRGNEEGWQRHGAPATPKSGMGHRNGEGFQ